MYQTRSRAQELRKVAANAVLADPYEFNEAVLGKERSAYATWIQNPTSWGGAIELSIFSRHFKKEIAAFDVQTKRVDVYGEGIGYGERVMLVYDGLHYDALAVAMSDGGGEGGDMTRLKVDSNTGTSSDVVLDVAMGAAGTLVERFHVHRQFTDTTNFTLRCSVCKVGLIGEKEAVEHANKTSHANFEEY
jgi:ubiquitin thioesterase OTU1